MTTTGAEHERSVALARELIAKIRENGHDVVISPDGHFSFRSA